MMQEVASDLVVGELEDGQHSLPSKEAWPCLWQVTNVLQINWRC